MTSCHLVVVVSKWFGFGSVANVQHTVPGPSPVQQAVHGRTEVGGQIFFKIQQVMQGAGGRSTPQEEHSPRRSQCGGIPSQEESRWRSTPSGGARMLEYFFRRIQGGGALPQEEERWRSNPFKGVKVEEHCTVEEVQPPCENLSCCVEHGNLLSGSWCGSPTLPVGTFHWYLGSSCSSY